MGLAVIDEQHRFGVMQRLGLAHKGVHPDVLVMTATPIPRTLALTLYGDLDVSVIDELPPGRKPIVTKHVTADQVERVYSFLKKQIDEGRQAYVVYPVIEESETQAMKAAEKMHEHLSREVFPELAVGLLHGRLPAPEKEAAMEDFKHGRIQILVSTTVIEVGVDVPNATVMVIEQAERFGLAQLHQLRGRVGRGAEQSYCILVTERVNDAARERIRTMVDTTDGFQIAEMDLKLRGPGEFFGHAPVGAALVAHRQHSARSGDSGNCAQRRAANSSSTRPPLPSSSAPWSTCTGTGSGATDWLRWVEMRVIAGEFRSRRLKSIPGLATRPTPDRLRETLFDILGSRVEGAVFLDAYAGTGAVGIEALSRGAARAIFIEKSKNAAKVIRREPGEPGHRGSRSAGCIWSALFRARAS